MRRPPEEIRKAICISQQRLKQLLYYDPDTGFFYWKKQAGRRAPGTKAGFTVGCGNIQIRIAGRAYSIADLIWIYTYNRWPKDVVIHDNGDSQDNRFSNLREVSHKDWAKMKFSNHWDYIRSNMAKNVTT
jgi:HNH endonuclease